jgi:hypothetical protein
VHVSSCRFPGDWRGLVCRERDPGEGGDQVVVEEAFTSWCSERSTAEGCIRSATDYSRAAPRSPPLPGAAALIRAKTTSTAALTRRAGIRRSAKLQEDLNSSDRAVANSSANGDCSMNTEATVGSGTAIGCDSPEERMGAQRGRVSNRAEREGPASLRGRQRHPGILRARPPSNYATVSAKGRETSPRFIGRAASKTRAT